MEIDYHSRPEISQSDIKLIKFSIKKYLDKKANPEKKKCFDLGHAYHTRKLEPEKFDYEILPYFECRSNAGKEFKAAWIKDNLGIELDWKEKEFKDRSNEVISQFAYKYMAQSDLDIINAMNEVEIPILDFGNTLESTNYECEKEIYFERSGVKCRGRLDYVNHDEKYIIDLKTTDRELSDNENLNEFTIQKEIRRWGLNIQGAMYTHGMFCETGEKYDFYLVFVEKNLNPSCQVVKLTEQTLTDGMFEIDMTLDKWIKYIESQKLPTPEMLII